MIPSAFLPIYVGTYTKTTSKGIYYLELDPQTGLLSAPRLAAETPDPTYIAFAPDRKTLHAVCATRTMSVAFRLNPEEEGELKPLQPPQEPSGPAPCHISFDKTGKIILLANYHTAIVASALMKPDATSQTPNVVIHTGHGAHPERQKTAHVHSAYITSDNRHVVVCDLGQDKIFTYRLDHKDATLHEAHPPFVATAPGAGPRHLVFWNYGKSAYVINEIANTIVVYSIEVWSGTMTPLQTISTVPLAYEEQSTAGAIKMHPSGKYLYGTNRGHDSIAIFKVDPETTLLTLVQIMPCGGKAPRDFAISPDGKWLVCAHQDSNTVVSFSIDLADGRLYRVQGSQEIAMPVCLLFG